jgi:hypothetical protein
MWEIPDSDLRDTHQIVTEQSGRNVQALLLELHPNIIDGREGSNKGLRR